MIELILNIFTFVCIFGLIFASNRSRRYAHAAGYYQGRADEAILRETIHHSDIDHYGAILMMRNQIGESLGEKEALRFIEGIDFNVGESL